MPTNAKTFLARARPLILARVVVAFASAVLPLVLARKFAPDDYGTYKQLFLVAQTLYFVLQVGVPQSLYFFVPRVGDQGRPYLFGALVFLAAVGALAVGAVLLGAPQIAVWLKNPELSRYAPALSVYLLGLLCSVPLEISLTARGRTRLASVVYLGSEVVRAATMTLPALLGFGLDGVMKGIAGFALLRLALTWTVVPRGGRGPWLSRAAIREQLRYALPFGAAIALALPQGYFHQYYVATHVAPAVFAVYAVGLFQLPVVDLLHTPTSEVLMVALGELERENRQEENALVFREAVARLAYAFVPLTAFLVVAAPHFIATLFTDRYLAAVPVFRVGVMGTLFAILPLEGVLRARGRTWELLGASALKASVNIPAVVVGVWRFGMVGAVGAWLLCELIGKAALFSRLPRALGARLVRLMPWGELARSAAASLAASLATVAVGAFITHLTRPVWALVVLSAAFGVAYTATLLVVGARLPFEMLGLARRAAAATAPSASASAAAKATGQT